jgi:hypothetical protein
MENTHKIEAKAFKTFLQVHFLFTSEQLSTDIKLTLHKTLIMSITCLPTVGVCSKYLPSEIAAPAKQGSLHN